MDLSRVGLFYTIAVAIIVPLEVFIGYLILRRDHLDRRNQLFFTFAMAMVIFVITNYLADAVTKPELLTWILRIYFLSTTVMTGAIFFFSFIFPKERSVHPFFKWFLGIFTVAGSIISLSPLLVQSVIATPKTAAIQGGTLLNPYNMLNLVILLVLLVVLTIFSIKSTGQSRRQMFSLAIGFYAFFIANLVVNIILINPDGTAPYARYGSYAAVFFLVSTTYAITAQHLFDIRVFISRAIIYSLLVSFSMTIYGVTVYFITSLIGTVQSSIILVSFITAGALAYSFDPLRQRIAEITDSWLFKKEYEQQEVTKKLSERLTNVIGLDEGLDAVMHTLAETLHLDHAVTYVFQTGDMGKQVVKRSRNIGYSDVRNLELTERDFMIHYFTTHPATVLLRNMEEQYIREEKTIHGDTHGKVYMTSADLRSHAIRKVIIDKLHALDIGVAIPLHLQGETISKGTQS